MIAASLYVLGVAALFALSLAPALIEWVRRTDVMPLRVVRANDGNPDWFADSFRKIVATAFPDGLGEDCAQSDDVERALRRLPGASERVLESDPGIAVACGGSIRLKEGCWIEHDLYARGPIVSGAGVGVRALLSDSFIDLDANSVIARWAHGRKVTVASGAQLFGRLTAEESIQVAAPAVFERLNAPVIGLGTAARPPSPQRVSDAPLQPFSVVDRGQLLHESSAMKRWVFRGDLSIPEGSEFEGDIVVHGKLRVGRGCRIRGSLKARGGLDIGRHCEVDGAVVAGTILRIGGGCRIRGPLVGEMRAMIGTNCVLGRPDWLTTLTSERIDIHPRTQVHGSVWARHRGRLLAA